MQTVPGVVPPLGHDGDYAAAVAALRAQIRFRLSLLDRIFSLREFGPRP